MDKNKKIYLYIALYAIGLTTVITFMETYFYSELIYRMIVPAIFAFVCPVISELVRRRKEKKKQKQLKNKQRGNHQTLSENNQEKTYGKKIERSQNTRSFTPVNEEEMTQDQVMDKPKTLVKKL